MEDKFDIKTFFIVKQDYSDKKSEFSFNIKFVIVTLIKKIFIFSK